MEEKQSKLLKVFLCVALCLGALNVNAQVVTKTFRNEALKNVLKEVKRQTKMSVIYNVDEVNASKRVTATFRATPVREVLNKVLDDNLDFEIDNQMITIFKREVRQDQVRRNSPETKKTVKGQVLDEKNEPVIGATIRVKGSNEATVSDVDGNFSINANEGESLLFSYLGCTTKRVVVGKDKNLNIVLTENATELSGVVVTALGIKKEAKSLSYNVQQFNSDALTTVKDANFVNSLNGKVAGVQFSTGASGIGGSTRIVMRGTKSLTGNNNVLYVIDGVPMNDIQGEQPEGIFDGVGQTGDAVAGINADDIESVSVLTGPSAAALYGANASNGVIIITTKKGKTGRVDATYTGSFQFSHPFVMPKFQNQYGSSEAGSYFSWGNKLATASDYDPSDFFQTSTNISNNASISVGSDKNQTYLSVGSTNGQGLVHNNNLDRYNLSFRNTTNFLDNRMTLDLSYMLTTTKEQNMISQGQYHNPLVSVYLFPAGDDFSKLGYYERYDTNRNFPIQYWPYANDMSMENPYWESERELFINHKTRNQLTASLNWKINSWLDLTGRVKYDKSSNRSENKFYASTNLLYASKYGAYKDLREDYTQMFAEAFLKANKYLDGDKWNISGVLGTSFDQNDYDDLGFNGHLLGTANIFTFENVDAADASFKKYQDDSYRTRLESVYATAQTGYRGMAYIDLTAREDWSSKLEDHFFYWSAGLSGIWTDIFPQIKSEEYLNYFKTRLSYAEVGNEPNLPYLKRGGYTINSTTGSPETSKVFYDDLNPERTKSWELGIDFVMFRNKLKFNATLYQSRTYDQFFNVPMSSSTGYTSIWTNGGRVDNKGIELSAHFNQPLGEVKWETYLTWTLNRNKIKSMLHNWKNPIDGKYYDLLEMYPAATSGYQTRLTEGGTMSDIYVRTLKTDEHGAIYVNPESQTVEANPDGNEYYEYAGHATPNYNLSWGNSFSWKGLTFSFLFNYRNGGVVVSETQAILDYYGASEATQNARNGSGAIVNGKGIPAQTYYQIVGNPSKTIDSQYVYSATNLRLSELSLGYDVPINKTVKWIKEMNISFIAHNLWMIYCKAPFDPELTSNTGTYYQGIDYFMQPSLRTMGFSVKLKF